MKMSSGLGQTFRRAAADYLFTPDRLLPDRARSPSVNMSAARVKRRRTLWSGASFHRGGRSHRRYSARPGPVKIHGRLKAAARGSTVKPECHARVQHLVVERCPDTPPDDEGTARRSLDRR